MRLLNEADMKQNKGLLKQYCWPIFQSSYNIKSKMIKLMLPLLIAIFIKETVAQSSCNGEHEYLDDSGLCRTCEVCPPGYEPSLDHCGFGVKESLYRCKPCDQGSYSSTTDYHQCLTCSPCELWNAEVATECSKTYDARCGNCYPGFYRPIKSDGQVEDECHKCDESNQHNCQTTDWTTVIIVSIVGVMVVVIATLLASCWFCRYRNRRVSERSQSNQSSATETKAKLPLLKQVSGSSDTVTSSSEITLTTSKTSIGAKNKGLQENIFRQPDHHRHDNSSVTGEYSHNDPYPNLPTDEFNTGEYPNSKVKNIVVNYHENPTGAVHFIENETTSNALEDAFREGISAFDTSSNSLTQRISLK